MALPSVITVTGKGTISYTYDAAGNKLQKTVYVVKTKCTFCQRAFPRFNPQ